MEEEDKNPEAKQNFEALKNAYAKVFDGTDGNKVLEDIRRVGFAYAPPFAPGQSDVTAFNCGLQAMLRHIETMIRPMQKLTDGQSQPATDN